MQFAKDSIQAFFYGGAFRAAKPIGNRALAHGVNRYHRLQYEKSKKRTLMIRCNWSLNESLDRTPRAGIPMLLTKLGTPNL